MRKCDPIAKRRAEASRWFAILQEPDLSLRVLQAWKKWESVPENRRIFDEIEWLLAKTNQVARPPTPGAKALSNDRYEGIQSVDAWRSLERISPKPHRSRWSLQSFAIAAALTLVVATAFFVIQPTSLVETFETATAQNRTAVLADGSKVRLGARTLMTVKLTSSARTIVLARGEALFQVARDAGRPFEVTAGSRTITAVGTAFNVRRRGEDQVVVTVTEGAVQISPNDSKPSPTQMLEVKRLQRGQEITYDKQGSFGELKPTDGESVTAWSEGRLLYRSEPLRQILSDVNRYSDRPVVLGDDAAGDLLYSGTVFQRDVGEWLAHLEKVYPDLEVATTAGNVVSIRMRRASVQH